MDKPAEIAIVDYRLGNLYSVSRACETAGLRTTITGSRTEIERADAVILPGVGAFGDAMAALRELDLVGLLRDIAQSDKLLVGICLGQQLLMSESHEFGRHEGLGIIPGTVTRFENPSLEGRALKVPQVGWNRIFETKPGAWLHQPVMNGIAGGEFMYFVHSYHVQPQDRAIWLSSSQYGQIEFCSSLARQNVVAFQFHPERSGRMGLQIYRNLARMIANGRRQETGDRRQKAGDST
jgi:glutamine amidotransferase